MADPDHRLLPTSGCVIGIRLNPDDIHIMHKSEYSGLYGDYSAPTSAEYR